MFLILSTITALLECGPIFLKICYDLQPWQILSLCLAYQIGNLFPQPFRCSKRILIGLTCLSTGLFLIAYFFKGCQPLQWLLYFAGILFLSTSLQSARASLKKKNCTVKKRISRVIGFLLSPVMHYCPTLLLLTCCLIILLTLLSLNEVSEENVQKAVSNKLLWKNPYYFIMLWHQLHYFSYAYAIVIMVYELTKLPFFTMMLFACTWLTYLLTEPLLLILHKTFLGSRPSTSRCYLLTIIIGHAFLCLILLLLPNVEALPLFSVLWMITGFGGGTVFAITEMCKRLPTYQKGLLDITENAGHFTGTAFAVLFLVFFPGNIQYLPYLSAFCAAVVLIMTIRRYTILHHASQQKGDEHYENPNHTC